MIPQVNSPCESPRKPLLNTTPPDVANAAEPNSIRSSVAEANPETGPETNKTENNPSQKKNTGLIRLLGAPIIDLAEAKKIALEEDAHEDTMKSMDQVDSSQTNHDSDAEYLDAANEETFTLETFESLIRVARVSGKSFLLARVTTVDPNNLTKLYFSYYAAHHINRVIFRTQPEEGLLHRMKSRNPLNNMLIVGDVHYFAVTVEEFDRAWAERQMRREQQDVLRSSVGHSELDTVARCSSFSHRRSMSESMQLGNQSTSSLPEVTQTGPTVLDLSQLDDDTSPVPVIYEASFFGTDDDFLMRADIRDFFKVNSVNPDDYQLFQLHRRSDLPYDLTVLGPDGRPLARGTQQTAQRQRFEMRNAWGLLDDSEHRSMICGLRLGYLSPMGFWLTMLVLTATTVFLSLVFIPSPFHYFAFAGIVLLFAVVLLVFVNWDDNRD
ncbi:hypothetical protein PSACC_00319 [Paramicrosporidium saccamoebae]|uniref:Uncharacterized protein n=1 Tax=Paramicrosporidium saccamoebae TaxID=1246581 RepID=A0A2H9TQ45_9FUNG|nr:hypothetical protein PSACC_00319 [Paramicrosporidium saccamoebae]